MPPIRPHICHEPVRLAVLVSGGGTTLANILEKIAAGRLRAEVAVVIASNAAAYESILARNLHLPGADVCLVNRKDHNSADTFSAKVFDLVRQHDADLVCLAGFLSLLVIPAEFAGRVLNIHPALLPAFGGPGMYGQRVHQAVLDAGCEVSGCTVHFSDQTYDTGPILLQKTCPVQEGDTAETLAGRVFELECAAYPEAIQLIADGRVTIEGGVSRVRAEE